MIIAGAVVFFCQTRVPQACRRAAWVAILALAGAVTPAWALRYEAIAIGVPNGYGLAINEAGIVVGSGYPPKPTTVFTAAFFYDSAGVHFIPPAEFSASAAIAINSIGVLACRPCFPRAMRSSSRTAAC